MGGNGDDQLFGGAGKDVLTGNAGNDRFIFQSVNESYQAFFIDPFGGGIDVIDQVDRITDFVRGATQATGDKIHLANIDAIAGGGMANDTFRFLGASPASGSDWKGAVWYEQIAGDTEKITVVYASTDADAMAEFQVEISGLVNLTQTDFYL
jgi:Ca2+-binding RTX toxin-like protein